MFRLAFRLFILALGLWGVPSAYGLKAYDELKSVLEKNPGTGKPVKNVEELLPLLSQELRSNFTFIYQSRSPHGDLLTPGAVTPLQPRVVLFSADGRLTLAFTGNPDKPGFNTVEAIHFEDAESRFVLSQFVLPDAKEGERSLNGVANPSQCLKCHGADPRPITDSYPLWPGFYGSVRDTFPKGSAELPLYRRFLKEFSKKGVYRHLEFPKGSSVSPYLDPKSYNPNTVEGGTDELRFLPNTRLGMAWTELNRKRLQRKIKASPQYLNYRKQLIFGLLGCEKLPITRSYDERIYSELYQENEDRLFRLGYRPEGPEKTELDMVELALYENVSEIRYLAHALGLDSSDWSLAFEPKSNSFFDGILSGIEGDKNFYLKEDFILEMLRDLALDEPEFRPYFKTYGSYRDFGYPFGQRLDLKVALQACKLREKFQELPKLPELSDSSRRIATLPALETFQTKLRWTELPFQRCLHCHEGEGALKTGRRIPLSDPTQLREILSRKGAAAKSLKEEILARVADEGVGQMPPKGERLSLQQRQALADYLNAVESAEEVP